MVTMSGGKLTALVLVLVLAAELVLLWQGQRRLFWSVAGASGSRLVAYVLAAPGTILHEASHYLACLALGVPVGRQLGASQGSVDRTRLFWPRRTAGGDIVLGGVPHARTDPMRQALIATAPLLLVPPVLAVATGALLGPHALVELPDVLGRVPTWHAVAWCYLALSCGQAVFPSPGDRVGLLGALSLFGLAAVSAWLLVALGGAGSAADVLRAMVGVLAVPAGAAALLLVVLAPAGRWRL
jgi:hypothetical protein